MARAIDASHFGEIMEQWKKDCLECDDQHGADVIADVILQLDDMPTLTQPNEPVTLEELREMDGEPVYVVPANEFSELGGWCVISTSDCGDEYSAAYVPGVDCWCWRFDSYGEQWLAYRRPPEGEEDT